MEQIRYSYNNQRQKRLTVPPTASKQKPQYRATRNIGLHKLPSLKREKKHFLSNDVTVKYSLKTSTNF